MSLYSFQFHKGTIRTSPESIPRASQVYFNSIKVQLELEVFCEVGAEPINFNSIKVQLEQIITIDADNLTAFQFHKGTIRTQWQPYNASLCNVFQFHKGTIRTTHWWL